MLTEKEIDELFEKLREKFGTDEETPKTPEDDLLLHQLVEFSDYFGIEIDRLRTLTANQILLLEMEHLYTDTTELPFELEQALLDHEAEVKKAGGPVKYLEQKKREGKASPIFPKRRKR